MNAHSDHPDSPKSTGPIRVIAVGDVSLNGRYEQIMKRRGTDYPWKRVLDRLRSADLRIGNLESPITDAPHTLLGKLCLRSSKSCAQSLSHAGFDVLTVANNHMMDFGVQGLLDTQDALRELGIATTGAGTNDQQAMSPLIMTVHDQLVGILAFCDVEQTSPLYADATKPGVARWNLERCLAAIQSLRPRVDHLILQLHWGRELCELPSPEQRTWCKEFVRAGVDVIVGHHPHVLQPLEWIDGKPIFHSLGNFLFSDMYWFGKDRSGSSFISRLRLLPLSRQTGWAEIILERGKPPRARLIPAVLNRKLQIEPDESDVRLADWGRLCNLLDDDAYEQALLDQDQLVKERHQWRWDWKSPLRRIELKLVQLGLMPGAVVAN